MILLNIFDLGSMGKDVRPSSERGSVAEECRQDKLEQLLQEEEATVCMLEFVKKAEKKLMDKKCVESAEEDGWTVGSIFFCF